jgi:hypothetical protein
MFGSQKRNRLSPLVLPLLCSVLVGCSLLQPKSSAGLYAKYKPTLIVKILVDHQPDAKVSPQQNSQKVSSISKQLSQFPELARPEISRDDFVILVRSASKRRKSRVCERPGHRFS